MELKFTPDELKELRYHIEECMKNTFRYIDEDIYIQKITKYKFQLEIRNNGVKQNCKVFFQNDTCQIIGSSHFLKMYYDKHIDEQQIEPMTHNMNTVDIVTAKRSKEVLSIIDKVRGSNTIGPFKVSLSFVRHTELTFWTSYHTVRLILIKKGDKLSYKSNFHNFDLAVKDLDNFINECGVSKNKIQEEIELLWQ